MIKKEKLRVITMSSGDVIKGMESEFKRVSGNISQFGALRLESKGYVIDLQIAQIAIDALYEPANEVKNKKNSIKKRAVKTKKK